MVDEDPATHPTSAPRPRADAARNRARILAVASDSFAAGEGDVTFDALARLAGVGVGTMYRNFPNRQSLVEAVYRSELEDVITHADALLAAHPPDIALRSWVNRYAAFVITKHGMAQAFQEAVARGAIAASETRERIRGTVDQFLVAGAEDGSLRGDVDSDDATTALLSAILGSTANDAQRARVLDIVVDGLRQR